MVQPVGNSQAIYLAQLKEGLNAPKTNPIFKGTTTDKTDKFERTTAQPLQNFAEALDDPNHEFFGPLNKIFGIE